MKNSLKKFLISTFIVGVSIFTSNNVFAENYKVNIAVLGNLQKGKTQVIRRLMGLEFQKISKKTDWKSGVYGQEKTYSIGDDVFECNYYDAPGYLKSETASIDQQINSAAIKTANIALIVVDPKQSTGEICDGTTSSIDEALIRHAANVRKVNPKCKVIVVINKIDEIKSQEELDEYKDMLEGARKLHRKLETDGVFTSAKDGRGICELEEKIINLLRLNKTSYETFDRSFIICKNDGKQQRKDRSVKGLNDDWYCSEGCLAQKEGEFCAYDGCKSKKLLLKVKNDGFISPHTGKMYCEKSHYVSAEGQCCSYKNCYKKFVVKDGTGFVNGEKSDKKYCCKEHRHKDEDWCTIV